MEKSMDQIEIIKALQVIERYCLSKNANISVAESATSGMLQNILGSAEGATAFFEGGITTYNCEQKMDHLLIPYSECSPCNGVSEEIAIKMALGVCKLFITNIGLSITGYASPIPEKDIYDLSAFVAISLNDQIIFHEKIKSNKIIAEEVKNDFCYQIIIRLAGLLKELEKKEVNKNLQFSKS